MELKSATFSILLCLLVAGCADASRREDSQEIYVSQSGGSFRAAAGARTSVGVDVDWNPPSWCHKLDCPEFEVQQTRGDVELRRYRAAHWISTNVTGTKWSDAYDKGYKRLQEYVEGGNEHKRKLPQTNPSFSLFYVGDAKAHTLQGTFTIEYFVPFELQDKPPQPTSQDLDITPVKSQDVWVVSFGGYATEDDVIKRGFEFIDNLTGDGIDVHTEFIGLALYDTPVQLIGRHNEIWLWSKQKPSCSYSSKTFTAPGMKVKTVLKTARDTAKGGASAFASASSSVSAGVGANMDAAIEHGRAAMREAAASYKRMFSAQNPAEREKSQRKAK